MLYRLIATLLRPAAWWGRTRVEGLEHVPREGPLLVVPNHDSQMDPVIVGIALLRRRQLRYLARANLWKIRGLAPLMNGMRQIPIERGTGDRGALSKAEEALRAGEAVCIFPEGKLSLGERLRARSGVYWLAHACPNVRVVLCAVSGTTDFVRFPRRPRVRVEVFEPASGQPRDGEEPAEMAERLLGELRDRVPPTRAGRRVRVSP
jgi:1-acyl-sn-glycerol-3-phosphate acyltransferase